MTFEEGAVTVELDALDAGEQAAYPGALNVPLEPAVYTWSTIGIYDAKAVRYLRSAARRLDSAALRVGEIDEMRNRLPARVDPPQELRRTLFRLIGTVELAVIAFGVAPEPEQVTAGGECLGASGLPAAHVVDRRLRHASGNVGRDRVIPRNSLAPGRRAGGDGGSFGERRQGRHLVGRPSYDELAALVIEQARVIAELRARVADWRPSTLS